MSTWRHHFDIWHKIRKLDINPIAEEGHILAGRDAEDLLLIIVDENYSFRGCHSFVGKRVPNLDGKGRREIDLIVITAKKMYIIECKNWSGTLTTEGNNWVQTTKRNGQISRKEHENVLHVNRLKMQLLIANLKNMGIDLRSSLVCQKVILMNSNLQILSPGISTHPDVITADRLAGYLNSQNANKLKTHEQLFSAVIGVLLDEEIKGKVLDGLGVERIGDEHHDRLIETIRELGTWDRVFLNGTKILSGDIWKSSISNIFKNRQSIDDVKNIQVRFVRSKWLGFFKALFKIGKPISLDLYDARGKLIDRVEANPHGIVRIQEAVAPTATDVDIFQIDRLVFGKYLEISSRKWARKKNHLQLFFWLAAIGSIPLLFPVIRHRLLPYFPNLMTIFGRSNGANSNPNALKIYTGKYDFGKYTVKIYTKDNKLWANTATGKAELTKSTTATTVEFRVVGSRQSRLGKYVFVPNRQGKISELLWIKNNGKQRKCPKITQ